MAWDMADKTAPSKINLPKEGAVVSSRAAMKKSRYISILLGPETAIGGLLTKGDQRVLVLLGRDEDQGKIAIQFDTSGKFEAKQQKNGGVRITVPKVTSTLRLNFDMPMVTVEGVRRVPMPKGGPPMLVIDCPKAFL